MKTYKVPAYRNDYGYITIQATSKKQAIDLVNAGEWNDNMYTVKGGDCGLDTMCTIKEIIEI